MGMGITSAVPPPCTTDQELVEFNSDRKPKLVLSPMQAVGASDDGFSRVSSEGIQHILAFLPLQDRAALLSTQRKLASEPLATRIQSYCGSCAQCASQNQHLCETPTRPVRDQRFWTAAIRRSGLTELRLTDCGALSKSILSLPDTATIHRAFRSLRILELHRESPPAHLQLIASGSGNIQELRFRDMKLDPGAFAKLVSTNQATLRTVDLEGCHTLTGRDLRPLLACRQLTSLSLAGCHNVDTATIAEVSTSCGQLQRLNLRFCHQVDDAVVEKIARSLPSLRELNLRYCMKITDAAARAVGDQLPLLTTLDLSQCSKLTDAGVGHLVASLHSLKFLRLWACGRLTSAAVRAIAEAAPALELVDIRSRDRLEAVIGGRDGLQLLARKRSRRWEPSEQVGVFKRMPVCAVAA